ncbi:hypothetical protein HU147_01335 [Planomicrobium chinense]|uniref:site-2 protease family protein n=1 Tax=Planococcus chinensis TaxID=272917 RepID=UPI001CC7CF5B|nr:site-2 protease family protein [Planococcus chinensis]MBZ5199844.1 hypothetical protein [Planococcus chinensis]
MLLEVMMVFLIISTALFIHEMGHAIATILRNKKAKAEIYMGSSSKEKKLKLKLGRITCYLTVALYAFCQPINSKELPPPTYKQRLTMLIGGPVASLLGFAALYYISHFFSGVPGNILINLAGASFFLFASPLIPFTYPSFLGGGPSDGLQILNLVKENSRQRKAVL